MTKEKRNNKIAALIVAIIAILVVALIVAILLKMSPSRKAANIVNKINRINTREKGALIVNNSEEWLENYKGDININAINATIEFFTEELVPEYRSIENPKAYYEANQDSIETYTGINNYEEFEVLVARIKEIKGTPLKLERVEYLSGTSKASVSGVSSILALQYEGNDKVLFHVNIKNKVERDHTIVEYSGQVEEALFDRERTEKANSSIDEYQGSGRVFN